MKRAEPPRAAPPEEGELVARAKGGDRAAFEALYRGHVARIHALCLRLAGAAGPAEELTQEAFVRAWRKLPSFRGESAFATWLHALAVRVVLSDRRADRRRLARVAPAEARPEPAVAPWTGEALDLERALSLLPPGARQAFVLHDVEGYTHEEIARRAGVAAGTVKAQLHRARRLLREVLER